ncbi:MAG: aspartate kinase [Rhodospirillaceae bacterium]|nr:aspartate kinase [Rhodospirillaceae bacterium]|tara:strand:- start:92 stop:1318 length:1227 start_codon:yes stop_codon:yes gene_type:complete
MALIVQKYGGTSVADLDCIKLVALRVKALKEQGHKIAVVVSAMAGFTDQLVDWVSEIHNHNDLKEYDSVLSSGEQITAGLLALYLQKLGISSRSWLGWQIPFETNDSYSSARITNVISERLNKAIQSGEIPVVAGFQGISSENRITTLGRGGSDTSAVALAASIGADRCDICTDVEGVFTADPRIVTGAKKIDKITYEEMLEMASQGAKVLQTRSVEMAMKHHVPLQVLSSFSDLPGTFVVDEENIVEQEILSGVTYSREEAKITILNMADKPGVAAALFGPLAEASINVDMIVQNVSSDGKSTDMTFTVPRNDLDKALSVIDSDAINLEFERIESDAYVAKISVIGMGMRSHAGVASKMFNALGDKGINIQVISTSEIKISVLVSEEYTELAVRALHTAYGLDAATK